MPGGDAERRRALAKRATELGIEDLWLDVIEALGGAFKGETTRSGIAFSLPTIMLPEHVNVRGSDSIRLLKARSVRLTFFPAAVHLCRERFEDTQGAIPFEKDNPPNAPPTADISQQWSLELDHEAWETHREDLTALARDVHAAWISRQRAARAT